MHKVYKKNTTKLKIGGNITGFKTNNSLRPKLLKPHGLSAESASYNLGLAPGLIRGGNKSIYKRSKRKNKNKNKREKTKRKLKYKR
tara:strand:- start:47 stop:304 length:258 start_codon:yes stop_codon:yes gene_type:complete